MNSVRAAVCELFTLTFVSAVVMHSICWIETFVPGEVLTAFVLFGIAVARTKTDRAIKRQL